MHLESIEAVGRQYRHIYLSPHYDDAVLSCGGTIALQRVRPSGAGDHDFRRRPRGRHCAYALQVLRQTGLGATREAVERRREEDAAACELLGADTLWLEFPEALFRGYDGQDALFGAPIVPITPLRISRRPPARNSQPRSPSGDLCAAGRGAPRGSPAGVLRRGPAGAAKGKRQVLRRLSLRQQSRGAEDRQRELGLPMEFEMVEVGHEIPARIEATRAIVRKCRALRCTEKPWSKTESGKIRPRFPGMKIERYWHW